MTAAPSPALLVHLFADRFLPPKGFRHAGIAVPCRPDVEVRVDVLAATMFAVAFWSLRESGALALSVEKRKKLGLIGVTRVAVRPLADPGPRTGLEQAVVDVVRRGEDDHVHALVRRWFGSDVEAPHSQAVQAEAAAGLELGLFERTVEDAGRGRVLGALLGSTVTTVEPRCDRIAELEGAAQEVHRRWSAFAAAEPDLHATLLDQCGDALTSRIEADFDGDD